MQAQQTAQFETVDPKWLLKAFAVVVGVALLCGYATLCLLFSNAQWQLVLHPGISRSGEPQPIGGQLVHFGPDATATPQLTGWWIPAEPGAPYQHVTLLYLRGGDGALADDTAALNTLHAAGLNLLAFNYRGYPATAGGHPTGQRMAEDAEAAWQYLVSERHVDPQTVVPYGVGIGASLAIRLAANHIETPALILDAPTGDLLDRARQSPQAYLLPVGLLFRERFLLAEPLAKLRTPKLILSRGSKESAIARQAADPKLTVSLSSKTSGASVSAFQAALSRFLDQYLPPPVLSGSQLRGNPNGRLPREPLK